MINSTGLLILGFMAYRMATLHSKSIKKIKDLNSENNSLIGIGAPDLGTSRNKRLLSEFKAS